MTDRPKWIPQSVANRFGKNRDPQVPKSTGVVPFSPFFSSEVGLPTEPFVRNLAEIVEFLTENGQEVKDTWNTGNFDFQRRLDTHRNRKDNSFYAFLGINKDGTIPRTNIRISEYRPDPKRWRSTQEVVNVSFYLHPTQLMISFFISEFPQGLEFETPIGGTNKTESQERGKPYKREQISYSGEDKGQINHIEIGATDPSQLGEKTKAFLNDFTQRALGNMRAFVAIPEDKRVEPDPDERKEYEPWESKLPPSFAVVSSENRWTESEKQIPFLKDMLDLEKLVLTTPNSYSCSPDSDHLSMGLSNRQYEGENYFHGFLVIEGLDMEQKRTFSLDESIIDSKDRRRSDPGFRIIIEGKKLTIFANTNIHPLARDFDVPLWVKKERAKEYLGFTANLGDLGPKTRAYLHEITQRALQDFRNYLSIPQNKRFSRRPPLSGNRINVPVIDNLPTNTTDPGLIAAQLENLKRLERLHDAGYTDTRGRDQYIRALHGLEGFFNHVRSLASNRVVDVGAGYGFAVKEFLQDPSDIDFYATNLTRNEGLEKLPESKVVITYAETMEGFEDDSLGGIMGVNSIAYSVSPELVVKRFDQLLVPGGIVKARFRHPLDSQMMKYGFQTAEEFLKFWRELGYDVALNKRMIVIAIKPGRPDLPTARTLMATDLDSYDKSHVKKSWVTYNRKGEPTYHAIQQVGEFD